MEFKKKNNTLKDCLLPKYYNNMLNHIANMFSILFNSNSIDF